MAVPWAMIYSVVIICAQYIWSLRWSTLFSPSDVMRNIGMYNPYNLSMRVLIGWLALTLCGWAAWYRCRTDTRPQGRAKSIVSSATWWRNIKEASDN